MAAVAAVNWVVGYAYCAPWRAYVIRTRTPARDYALVGALLGLASMPWGLFIYFGDALARPDTLRWAVIAAMAPGAAMMLASYLRWEPKRPSRLRSVVVLSGGVVFLGWIPAYGWVVSQLSQDTPALGFNGAAYFVAAIFLLPVPFIALWMAATLFSASREAQPPT